MRIPYFHRTMATELCGVIHGEYKGSVRPLEPGGLSFEASYMPHGESYEAYALDREQSLSPRTVGKVATGFLSTFLHLPRFPSTHPPPLSLTNTGFMIHVPSHFGLTKWATQDHPDIRREYCFSFPPHPRSF